MLQPSAVRLVQDCRAAVRDPESRCIVDIYANERASFKYENVAGSTKMKTVTEKCAHAVCC